MYSLAVLISPEFQSWWWEGPGVKGQAGWRGEQCPACHEIMEWATAVGAQGHGMAHSSVATFHLLPSQGKSPGALRSNSLTYLGPRFSSVVETVEIGNPPAP